MNRLPDFNNTEIAFRHLSLPELKRATRLYSAMANHLLVTVGSKFVQWAINVNFPIQKLLKKTIFNQFCGGTNLHECNPTVDKLYKHGVYSILDYASEDATTNQDFDANLEEIKKTIDNAANNPKVPFAVFKPTAIAHIDLLKWINQSRDLTNNQEIEFQKVFDRFDQLAAFAYQKNVRLLIDAEYGWIQRPVDDLVMAMMRKYNTNKPIVWITYQMYLKRNVTFLAKNLEEARDEGFKFGVKLVRGAYLEQEKTYAASIKLPPPTFPTKEKTDEAFDNATTLCLKNIDICSVFVGTHNEQSNLHAAKTMDDLGISRNSQSVWFSQLYGMSDHISFNLTDAGYNVAKYIPFGDIKTVLPYLLRRAEENTAIQGQVGRELKMLCIELNRRTKK